VDGAGALAALPSRHAAADQPDHLLSSSFFQMIGAFQLFHRAVRNDARRPANSSLSVVQYIYLAAFRDIRMDKAAAMAWVLFVFIFAFTLFQNWMQKRWVYYESE
jgi:multiple sugar transport system permease protein